MSAGFWRFVVLGEYFDYLREAVFSMAKSHKEIGDFIDNHRDVVFEHLLKLYYYRDTQWVGVWVRSVYAAMHSVPRRKIDSKYPHEDFLYQHLWLDVEDVWVERFSYIVDEVFMYNSVGGFEFLDESVVIENPRPQETHDLIQDYMKWLSRKLSSIGNVTLDSVLVEVRGLLDKYPYRSL